jgi:small subunit ribosomal protein S21
VTVKTRRVIAVDIAPENFQLDRLTPGRTTEDTAVEIIVNADEPVERALKRFKRLCQQSGVLAEVRERRHYLKPSEARKQRIASANRQRRASRVRT